MALFPRKKPRGPDEENGERVIERRQKTIGELLGEARRHYGTSVEDVGAALRIRPAFLKAIEENQYGRLPGPVYALGFVRTYAEYLGLDGEAFARRFKSEVAGLDTKQDFTFPMPLPERSLPGAPLLLVALIIASCAYAVWYYRASGERTQPERVAAVPEQLIPLPPAAPPPAPATAGNATESNAAETPPAPPLSTTPSTAAPPVAGTPAASNPAGAVPAPPATEGAATAQPSIAGAAAAAPRIEPPAALTPPSQVAAPSPPPPPAVPEAPAAAPAPDAPRVYGITNGPVRIVIKATADSWVQVKDSTQSVLQMRVLHAGEILRVPDKPGLMLRTGNAGGLEISVDGRIIPSIGPSGKPRNLALDPQRLLAGAAATE